MSSIHLYAGNPFLPQIMQTLRRNYIYGVFISPLESLKDCWAGEETSNTITAVGIFLGCTLKMPGPFSRLTPGFCCHQPKSPRFGPQKIWKICKGVRPKILLINILAQLSEQFITTSAEVTPNGGLERESSETALILVKDLWQIAQNYTHNRWMLSDCYHSITILCKYYYSSSCTCCTLRSK